MFLWIDDQPAKSRDLDSISDEEEHTGHDASVVMCYLWGYQVRSYREHQKDQDEEINTIVPARGEVFGSLRKVSKHST